MFQRNMSPPSSGSKSKPSKKRADAEPSLLPASVGFLLGLLSDFEEGGNIFLRNTGLYPNYTASRRRRPYSS
jgi:hypothetical protein